MKRMLKIAVAIVMALTVAVLCMPMSMAAELVKGYGLPPVTAYYYDDGSLVFEGEGELSGSLSEDSFDYNGYPIPWDEHSEEITSVVISEGITSCDESAILGGLDHVTEITIPGKGFTVAEDTFVDCESVEKFIISGDSDAYTVDASGVLYSKDMTKLIRYPAGKTETSFTVPSTVRTIGASAFAFANDLETVILPSGLTTIENSAFCAATSLTSVNIPDSVRTIGQDAFMWASVSEIVLPEGITEVGDWAFRANESLLTITIPKSMTEIDKSWIEDCTAFVGFKYCGTEEEWEKITFTGDSEIDFDSLKVTFNNNTQTTGSNANANTNASDKDVTDKTDTPAATTTKAADKTDDKSDDSSNNMIIIIAIAVVVIVIVIAAVVIILSKKKK